MFSKGNNLSGLEEDNADLNNEHDNELEEDYDAFNEETFASNLSKSLHIRVKKTAHKSVFWKDEEDVGDWEAEHDNLLLFENEGFPNEPLTKLQITPTPKEKTPDNVNYQDL